jgi:hypothetical protein
VLGAVVGGVTFDDEFDEDEPGRVVVLVDGEV